MAYWNTSVQTFSLPHDKLWLSALKCVIAAFCSANFFVMKINNLSVILPTDRCISYRFLLIRNRIQMK